ncbi:MAG: ABC transporter permease [Clostridiaceae bacterium]
MAENIKKVNPPENKYSILLKKYSGYLVFLLLIVFFSFSSPAFLKNDNIINILRQSSILGIVSCGMTCILIGGGSHVIKGGIDISLANNLALNSAIAAKLLSTGVSIYYVLTIVLLFSLLVGLINSFMIVKLRVIPLLGTLSMMYLLQGCELLITNNKVVSSKNAQLVYLANTNFLGLPLFVWIFLIVSAVLYIIFNRSVFGNWVNAVGGNDQAAKIAGINVSLVTAATYIIASITAGIASVLITARLTGSVPGIGDTMLFDILLASYLSAVFSHISKPNIPGTIVSSLFVGILTNGFTLINVSTYWVYAIKGVLILLAVSFTTRQQRRVG